MRKIACVVVAFCLLVGTALAVYAEGEKPFNETTLLVTDGGFGSTKFNLTDKFSITGIYEDELLKAGLRYDFSDRFGVEVGQVYDDHDDRDDNTEDSFTYGGIDFVLPFGNHLDIYGSYNTNYRGENWDNYEVALKIQMFKNHYIYSGISGDTGAGVPLMKYNEERHEGPHMFLRGDFSWYWRKASISLRPLLFVKGYFYHDYTFKYHLKENASIVLNVNNYDYNQNTDDPGDIRYLAGVEFKF